MSEHLFALRTAWEDDLRRKIRASEPGSKPYLPQNVYASQIKPCARCMALNMMHPEDDPFDKPLMVERMEQGNEAENAINARLHRIGIFCKPAFKIVEQQLRMEVKDRDGTVLITGKTDGRLRFEDGAMPLYDVKAGKSFDGCETIEDLDQGLWSRSSIDQMVSYLYADDKQKDPRWGFILVRNFSAFPTFIRVNLDDHLGRLEGVLKRARLAVDARHQRGPLPDFIQNVGECRRCPHLGKSCTPPMDFGPGIRVITDPELITAAETRDRNRMARDDYERADKALKGGLRGVASALLGNYQATGEWQPRTKYDIPAEVKAQYAREDEHGAFKLTIERLP
jgi:hypothetical protein